MVKKDMTGMQNIASIVVLFCSSFFITIAALRQTVDFFDYEIHFKKLSKVSINSAGFALIAVCHPLMVAVCEDENSAANVDGLLLCWYFIISSQEPQPIEKLMMKITTKS